VATTGINHICNQDLPANKQEQYCGSVDKTKLAFFAFLADWCMSCQHELIHWSIILAYARDAVGEGGFMTDVLTYFGMAIGDTTRRISTQKQAIVMPKEIVKMLSLEKILIFVFANCQQITKIKYQVGGGSCNSILATS
jgi:hypothetical protein